MYAVNVCTFIIPRMGGGVKPVAVYTLQYLDFHEMVRAEKIVAASDSDAVEIAQRRVKIYRDDFNRAVKNAPRRFRRRRHWYVLCTCRNEDTGELVFTWDN